LKNFGQAILGRWGKKMPNESGKGLQAIKEIAHSTALHFGNARLNGTKPPDSTSLTPAHSSIRSGGATNPGMEHFSNTPIEVRVKPLYFKFIDARDQGELPAGMTWDKYQKNHK
jgi:hypothetical protein